MKMKIQENKFSVEGKSIREIHAMLCVWYIKTLHNVLCTFELPRVEWVGLVGKGKCVFICEAARSMFEAEKGSTLRQGWADEGWNGGRENGK